MLDAETRGERAAQVLESEAYQEAVEAARDKLKDAWAKETDPVKREAIWQQFRASEAVTTELKIIRDRGIVERKKREKEEHSA